MSMKFCWLSLFLLGSLATEPAAGEVRVIQERVNDQTGFAFHQVPLPANNDALTTANIEPINGAQDSNSGPLAVLTDGSLPSDSDQPSKNFFFAPKTKGGQLRIDLGKLVTVKQVNTYSWHTGTRAPQVYRLYAATGETNNFQLSPQLDADPANHGWTRLANVDTRPHRGDFGGKYGVSISNTQGHLGKFRYLLLDIAVTESDDAFGNTFYSELDVIDADGPRPTSIPVAEPRALCFQSEDGKYQFSIDTSAAPDLEEWSKTSMQPVIIAWYPKIVELLSSEGFKPATRVSLRYRDDMQKVPAYAIGAQISLNADWFRSQRQGEARGAVVHELVHVVQDYWRTRRENASATQVPGWIVEGIADYVRWFLYEPESRGAELNPGNIATARYDASYRVTGNFLDWVAQNHDPAVVAKLNAASRSGKYSDQLWRDWTGCSLEELERDWKRFHEKRLAELN